MNRPVVAAWLALLAGLFAGGEIDDAVSFAASGVFGLGAVWLGFAAAGACGRTTTLAGTSRLARVMWTMVLGIAFGLVNLAANWLIANHDPALRALLEQRFAGVGPVLALVAAPLKEEVLVRLFLMSGMAWMVWKLSERRQEAFAVALIGSSVAFASMHLARPFPGDADVAAFYRMALLVKYTLAGLPMGWLFWRWGLPYAMLCHFLVNATHIALERFVF